MTVAELDQRMSSREFTAWAALDQIDPLTDTRTDTLFAMLATVVNRSMGGKANPKDFVPKWDVAPPSPKQLVAGWKAYATAHNARLSRSQTSRSSAVTVSNRPRPLGQLGVAPK